MNSERLTHFSNETLVEAMHRNLMIYMEALGSLPGASVEHDGPVSRISLGIPMTSLNYGVINAEPLPSRYLPQLIARTKAFYRKRSDRFSWYPFGAGKTEALHDALLGEGFEHKAPYPCMAVELQHLPEAPENTIQVNEAESAADKHDWTEAMRRGFGYCDDLKKQFAACFGALPSDEKFPLRLFLARAENEPAAGSAMLCLGGGVAGLYAIATVSGMRRRGVGQALTQAALEYAKKMGYRAGVLQASQMGVPLYQRVGFLTFDSMSVYHSPEPL